MAVDGFLCPAAERNTSQHERAIEGGEWGSCVRRGGNKSGLIRIYRGRPGQEGLLTTRWPACEIQPTGRRYLSSVGLPATHFRSLTSPPGKPGHFSDIRISQVHLDCHENGEFRIQHAKVEL